MNLRLLNITPEIARLAADPKAFERAQGASFGSQTDTIRGIVEANESYRARNAARSIWSGYLAIDPDRKRVVGSCAFKGEPIDGVVEIAYFTLPPYEGKGYANAMVAELVRLCQPSPAVRRIVAHTMPEESAVTAVLRKNGFTRTGEFSDPEDGLVWRWELSK